MHEVGLQPGLCLCMYETGLRKAAAATRTTARLTEEGGGLFGQGSQGNIPQLNAAARNGGTTVERSHHCVPTRATDVGEGDVRHVHCSL